MVKKTLFQCPNCSKPLSQGHRQYFCPNGHCFDISKKGYVNLLLPSHIGAGTPGDTKEMLQSRREFLNKGYYERFSDKLNTIVANILPTVSKSGKSTGILDAGCGEGYYICRLNEQMSAQYNDKPIEYYGIDVSKATIHYASGRDKEICFAVASNYHIPILKEAIDCAICIFAPRDEKEFRRILKPAGKLVVAAPGPQHLYSFRQLMYDKPEPIGLKGTVSQGFRLIEQYNAAYNIQLECKQDILNLFMMTPYSRHADMRAVNELSDIATEVDINILVYEKL